MTPGKGPVWVVFAVITSTGCIGPHVAPQDKRDASAVTARSEPAAETVDAPRTATPPTGVPVPIPPIVGVGSTDASRPDDVPVVEVRPVVVASTRESYSVSNSTTATKTDTPIHETPASIQVVPRQVIEDQKTPRMKDALENVSGVRPNQSIGSGNRFIIRGFPDLGKTYRNGLLATSPSGFPFEMDTANIESIEVLKGPASILYGRIEPGGMINVNTKRPLDTPHGALEQQFGSYSFYRTLWDVGGAITDSRSLSVRFAGGYQNSGSFRDFNFIDRKVFNPSVTWRPTDKTTMTVDVEILKQDFRADSGIPVIGTRPAPVPISRSYGDPNTPVSFTNKTHIGFNLDHTFNESWKLTNRFLSSFIDAESIWANPAPAFGNALQADGRTLNRNIFGQTSYVRTYATNLDLTGKFRVMGTQHKLLVGLDYTKATTDYWFFGNFNVSNPALAIDLFNPTYGIPPGLFTAARSITERPNANFNVFQEHWYGLYIQDQVTVFDRLHLLLGGRYDWAEVGRGRGATFDAASAAVDGVTRKDSRFNPRFGLLYDLTPWLAMYGNYVTSFGANNGVSSTNQPFPPQTGKQREAGLKADLFDHRLNATLAFYHLTRNNLVTPDLASGDPLARIVVGEQRSQGIEFDMTGRVTNAVSVIGSYAYTDTRVTKDNSGLQEKRLPGVPLHGGSLWMKYDFAELSGPVKGLSVGFGTYISGSRHGDIQNTFTLPGYVRLDGFAAYRWMIGPTRAIAQVTVRNLLNQEYYENADQNSNVAPRNGVYPGAPMTVFGSLRLEY
ncbi:TonB-dependent siderophore receptor [Nitrospira defluvii]|uniref:TonB-dependent siderophore receptor n=1 Tax=Nitrospira defluvii TaxID=330214 RepID=D8PB07_9BACT|nr:TonB-dependent siderophore receptor [Nitrospira defluvii]